MRCLGKPSSAAFSNLFTRRLKGVCETTSPTRIVRDPAFRAVREIKENWEMRKKKGCDWLANWGGFWGEHPQTRLRVCLQNGSGIRATNQLWVFRGNKLVLPHPC